MGSVAACVSQIGDPCHSDAPDGYDAISVTEHVMPHLQQSAHSNEEVVFNQCYKTLHSNAFEARPPSATLLGVKGGGAGALGYEDKFRGGGAFDYLGDWAQAAESTTKPLYSTGGLVLQRPCLRGDEKLQDFYEEQPRPLGWGNFGSIMCMTNRLSGAKRAVKSVIKDGGRLKARFIQREAAVLRNLDHPNIIKLYEIFETKQRMHLVMELCDGGDLISYAKASKKPIPEAEIASIFWQMLSAVQHMHARGYVHRDVKPEHFLFCKRSDSANTDVTEIQVKLIDFGLARKFGSAAQSQEERAPLTPRTGTAAYMAPELYAKSSPSHAIIDRADVWAFGVILHVLFSGDYPAKDFLEQDTEDYFSAPIWGHVSASGLKLLRSLLQRDPLRRPSINAAMKSSFFTHLETANLLSIQASMVRVPAAMPIVAALPPFVRLALVAVAREMQFGARHSSCQLYQALELHCNGRLTQQALSSVATSVRGPVAFIADELSRLFKTVDSDGSGSLSWSELEGILLVANLSPAGGSAGDKEGLPDDACFRAFDLLSAGQEVISAESLQQLDAGAQHWNSRGSSIGYTPRESRSAPKFEQPLMMPYREMMADVSESAHLSRDAFVELIRSSTATAIQA
eukprot:TRINITY_DN41348_c0_g1_i1.p1 TRINITY_DN41348_c0_g1~~TRINITY_DN41348_c0_g1_i1.p1  ORF type:complete len:627 (+),score=135.61 TRINITY_DN41348_c0_g1_i1:116-1996(+)